MQLDLTVMTNSFMWAPGHFLRISSMYDHFMLAAVDMPGKDKKWKIN